MSDHLRTELSRSHAREIALRAENERLTGRVAELTRERDDVRRLHGALILDGSRQISALEAERDTAMKQGERDTATRALAVLDRLAWLAAEEDSWFGNENDIAVQRAAAERHRATLSRTERKTDG